MTSDRMRRIPIATLATGEPLHLTIHTFSGGTGPTVGISAAIHGDEPIGVEVLRRLAIRLAEVEAELHGTVLLAPLANPLAFERNTRNTSLDHLNLNRLFPGDPDGWLSERLAHAIATEFLDRLDVYIDIHSGGNYPVVDYVYLTNAPELSRAFGSRLLFQLEASYDGTTESYVNARGVPAVTIEIGGGIRSDEHYAERALAGVINQLRVLGVFPGTPFPAPEQILMKELAIIRPKHGGFLVPRVRIADLTTEVPGGTVLGEIYNPQTFELLESIIAPFDRSILVLLRDNLAPIHPGAYMYMVGNAATATILQPKTTSLQPTAHSLQ